MLEKSSKIYIAGHRGLVGSAIWNNLYQRGFQNLVGRTHHELDLTNQQVVEDFSQQNVLMQLSWQQHLWEELWQTAFIVPTSSCKI